MQDLRVFFEPVHFIEEQPKGAYHPLQWGANIICFTDEYFDISLVDVVLVGCGEWRGENEDATYDDSANEIRKYLYQTYNWHYGINIGDAGNIRQGANLEDTRAALQLVLNEIHAAGKMAIVLGGSHDLTLQQYGVFKKNEMMAVVTMADMLVDLNESEIVNSGSFLMDMLTGSPNFISHYSHIAFQSYYANPRVLETLDKLRFDFFRLGKVREHIEDMEPVLRASNMFSFDMSAIKVSEAPSNITGSPNGLTGEEACTLTKYAGMAKDLSSVGIYGYDSRTDTHGMTAKLISQMIWYFIDGILVRQSEAELSDLEEFLMFHVSFTENDTTFLKSKRTNRWWMKLPNRTYIPCSYNDYLVARNNDIPERWLREQERLM